MHNDAIWLNDDAMQHKTSNMPTNIWSKFDLLLMTHLFRGSKLLPQIESFEYGDWDVGNNMNIWRLRDVLLFRYALHIVDVPNTVTDRYGIHIWLVPT